MSQSRRMSGTGGRRGGVGRVGNVETSGPLCGQVAKGHTYITKVRRLSCSRKYDRVLSSLPSCFFLSRPGGVCVSLCCHCMFCCSYYLLKFQWPMHLPLAFSRLLTVVIVFFSGTLASVFSVALRELVFLCSFSLRCTKHYHMLVVLSF